MAVITDQAAAKLGWHAMRSVLAQNLVSVMGQEQLSQLRPSGNFKAIQSDLASTDELQQALERGDVLPLEDFLDVRDILERALPEGSWVKADELEAIRRVCRASRRVKKALGKDEYPVVARRIRQMTVLSDLEQHIESIVDSNGEVREDASPELRQIRRRRRRLQVLLRERLRKILQMAVAKGLASETQLTVRGGRMVIPLRAEAKRKIRGFVHDASFTGKTVYLEPAECMELGNDIRLAEAEEAREIERLLRHATGYVRADNALLQTNLTLLGTVDLLHAKARLARRLGGVIPKLSEQSLLDIREGKSPVLLLHAGESKQVVPLNLVLGDDVRTLVITGPNAGGKTVAMKTAGLMAVMLGCGIPVPVHPASRFGVFKKILVEIGDEQSVEHDLSTFSARVAGLKRMCEAAGQGVLLLIDEIGTGTDPAEGASLAQAVLEHFTSHGALTIVTTHHGTLKAYAHDTPGVQNGSLSFDQRTMSPTFIFRQGLPGASFAFQIAERMSLRAEIIARARTLVGQRETSLEALMVTYEALSRKLEDRLAKKAEQQALEKVVTPQRKAKPAKPQRPGRAKPVSRKSFSPGQWVYVDQGKTAYEIIELDKKRAMVAFGNMRLHVGVDRLQPAKSVPPATGKQLNREAPKASLDVRGFRVNDAVRAVEQFVDQGLGHSLVSLEIIHGKGTGALREAIHAQLEQMGPVSEFVTPPINPGVTFVKLA